MNRFQKEINQTTKYLITILTHLSFYEIRKRVRNQYKRGNNNE